MKLEHFGFAEPGDCRVVFTASAEELAEAVAAEQAGENPPADEEDLLTAAVNRAILTGFSTLYSDLLKTQHILPVTDPDFELLAVHKAEGFRAGAQFFCLPPLELGRYTGFVQPIRPRPIRQLNIELDINQHHGDADRAADAAGCDAVIFVDDSVDRFNPKVVRATAGSLFHVPVLTMTTQDFLGWCAGEHSTLVAADVHGTPDRAPEQLPGLLGERGHMLEHELQDSSRPLTVLFGNEARGLPAHLVEQADRVVAIPIYGKAESLNLATSAAVMLMSLAMSSHIGKM